MAHEITIRENGFAETAFVGQVPWHGLGQAIDQDATIEQWQVAAGMDWTVESARVEFSTPTREVFTGQNVLYRSDTKMPLSVVSDRYKPVQPAEVLEFFRNLVDVAGFKIHVAGTLAGGKKLWAIAETGRYGEVVKDDKVGGFLLLSTSCDRTLATTARFTSIRVVCNNTLGMALANRANVVSFTHLSKFNPEVMQNKLMGAVESFGSFMEMAKHLQTQKMNTKSAMKFLSDLIAPWNQVKRDDHKIEDNRQFKKILELWESEAKGMELVGHTKWGMLNAVTEYIDHHASSRTDDARLDSAWFGRGDRIKQQAMELLVA